MARLANSQATPVVSASAIYASGDAVGGLLTFSGLGGTGMGKILSINIIDKGHQKAATDVLLFRSSVTATADNAPMALSAADALKTIGCFSIVTHDYVDCGSVSIATKSLGLNGFVDGVDDSLYGLLITRGTPTYATTSDLTIQLTVQFENPQGA